MRTAGILSVLTHIAVVTVLPTATLAATDGYYSLLPPATIIWDGTDASRFKAAAPPEYDFIYGDDSILTYNLPWAFSYYGQAYTHIYADTNGNIWFANTASTSTFDLMNTGKGPVIAVWHNDLSSMYYGGVFIQHKTYPERIVIEWKTETFGDEGYNLPNNFEIVLYQNGDIRADYKIFNAESVLDSGSGISKSDNSHLLSITDIYAKPVYEQGNKSFAFAYSSLQVNIAGTGSGTVTSTPAGVACNTSCLADLPLGTSNVTLSPAAAQYSVFSGWTSGSCTGTGNCQLILNGSTAVTATFDKDIAHQVSIGGTTPVYFNSIQAAYDAAQYGAIIKLWGITYNESLDCNRPIEVTLQGGYDSEYTTIIGETIVNGEIVITDGTVVMDGVTIKE